MRATTQTATFPRSIGLEKWADSGFFWQGDVALRDLPRVYALLDADNQAQNPTIHARFCLEKKDGVVWFDCQAQGVLWLSCDRCLQPVEQSLNSRCRLAILQSESDADRLDDDADFLIVDEFLDRRKLPLAELLEDEILLTVPLATTHTDCNAPAFAAAKRDSDAKDESPFAVLAQLKKGG